jgi:kinesin family protein 6/9
MTGGVERYVDRGIIPRAISAIFADVAKRADSQYAVHISYLEIYQDTGYDLLDPTQDAKTLEDLPRVCKSRNDSRLCDCIMVPVKHGPHVPCLREHVNALEKVDF